MVVEQGRKEHRPFLTALKNNSNYMKRLAIVVIAVGVILGGITWYKPAEVEFVAQEPQIVEKTVEVDTLEEAIKTAQNAKLSVIEASAQKAYDEEYNQEMKKVELEVVKAYNDKLGARQTQLEKETKTY